MTYKVIFEKWFWGPRTPAEMISGWGSVIAEMISGYGKFMLEKWFQGVGIPDHPKIISKMISRGGGVQPPECWGDDHTAYVVTLKGMMSTASPNAVFGWLLALVRGYMSFNVNLINIISTLPPLKLLSSATFSIRPHCRHHYYHHYVMFLTLMFYAYLTYYLSPI